MGDIEAVADVRIIDGLLIVRADARTFGGAASTAERQHEVDCRRADDHERACDPAHTMSVDEAPLVVLDEWAPPRARTQAWAPPRPGNPQTSFYH